MGVGDMLCHQREPPVDTLLVELSPWPLLIGPGKATLGAVPDLYLCLPPTALECGQQKEVRGERTEGLAALGLG